ncbi:Predicted membrane protein [Phaffia rhodozyma]|uniref:Predicted membrane protein n=1 Tax=Phaffia rhodozyma TaxID=264483 RepID=A0A0F7SRY2_PHARH|nr:Predicted membrane protein [Phaffia rhodozyma]
MKFASGMLSSLALVSLANAYQVKISSSDEERQICSGMWAGTRAGSKEKTSIELSFTKGSGQLALVVYEWSDVDYLGKPSPSTISSGNEEYAEYLPKTYICTTLAYRSGLCQKSDLGEFIINNAKLIADNPGKNVTLNNTSIYTTALKFASAPFSESSSVVHVNHRRTPLSQFDDDDDDIYDDTEESTSSSSTSTSSSHSSSFHSSSSSSSSSRTISSSKTTRTAPLATSTLRHGHAAGQANKNSTLKPSHNSTRPSSSTGLNGIDQLASGSSGVRDYDGEVLHYQVTKTGYYCIGAVPVTLVSSGSTSVSSRANSSTSANHAEYEGTITFNNIYQGQLPAAEHPKINFYLFLTCLYIITTLGWCGLCYKYRAELLPIQNYVTGTLIYLCIEMGIYWVYYRYLNAHGYGGTSTAFLLVVSALNAGRNSLSFFLLLIVSMGLSVVTPTLGTIMNRIKALTVAHFFFGVVYSIGIVQITLETASLVLLLSLIIGLSFTLTSFLMWTAVSLNGTILHLEKRKQHHKLQMFKRLNTILWVAVFLIAGFFVISSISISDRTSDDYAPRSWKYRWFLLDGSLSLIYLGVFASIAWLWRPTGNNVRFAMSEEIAQDEAEADADDFELSNRPGGPDHPGEDDDEDDEDDTKRIQRAERGMMGQRSSQERDNRQVVFALDDEEDQSDDDLKDTSKRDHDELKDGEEERLIGKDR